MDFGESSTANSSQDIVWAKLVPSDPIYSEIELRLSDVVICSEIMSPAFDKQEWCKVTRNSDLCSATIENKSSSTILVDEAAIPSGNSVVIKCGSEIIPGPRKEGYLSYRFEVTTAEEFIKKELKISLDVEHAKCSICLNIWHDVVTVAPCLHNFCNGCFSEWLRRSQEKHSNVLCPQCRAVVQFVGRNHFLLNIEENILQADPSLRRPDEEVAVLESHASIQSNLVLKTGKKPGRKRPYSPPNQQIEELESLCPQCDSEYAGFQCSPNTVHQLCHACGGMMPSRINISVPQHCLGCDQAFCGAYWHTQGFGGSDSHPVCSRDTLKPMVDFNQPLADQDIWISERTISRIPALTHESNQHEQNITESCIRQMKTTLQDVISELINSFNNRIIDRTRLQLNHPEMITAASYVCNECYDKLVSFLLYWFRITKGRYHLPPEASNRQDCWYGYACRTQRHNEEHARKRNHVCRPTRGHHM